MARQLVREVLVGATNAFQRRQVMSRRNQRAKYLCKTFTGVTDLVEPVHCMRAIGQQNAKLVATHFGQSDMAMAVRVAGYPSNNEIPHIFIIFYFFIG